MTCLEQMRREAGLEGQVQLVDAGDAGTDDDHVDVGPGWCRGVHLLRASQGAMCSPRRLSPHLPG